MFSKFKKPEVPEVQLPMTFKIDDSLYNTPSWEVVKKAALFGEFKTDPAKKPVVEEEEWIWVEGYKGVNADLTAHGKFQYEIGKTYHMDADVEVKTCCRGFHLCLSLKDVFRYYSIGYGNRFFKVSALVRKKDFEKYGTCDYYSSYDKLAAKTIILERELTPDEIFYENEYADWTEDEKKLALAESPKDVYLNRNIAQLVGLGYSEKFAQYIAEDKKRLKRALLMESQPGLSMDMKVFAIMFTN